MNNISNYYRIKMQWKGELEDGSLDKVKTEDLVYATSYTEAEKVAYALIESQQRAKHDDVISLEIIKTKIDELLFDNILQQDEEALCGMVYNYFEKADVSEGLYAVKIAIVEVDERTAKEKTRNLVVYTPASDNHDAADKVTDIFSTQDVVVRSVTFDAAESILWPLDVFQSKSKISLV